VAPLIVESARAARDEARRVRSASCELRTAVRASSRRARAGTEGAAAAAAAAARTRHTLTTPSPWSGLEWSREDEQLGRVLVPLD
jgi:hypothetical protein